jgi:DNA-binding beta-propeller fold protein YncE
VLEYAQVVPTNLANDDRLTYPARRTDVAIAASPDRKAVYVVRGVHRQDGKVTPIDTSVNGADHAIPVGVNPAAHALGPGARQFMLLAALGLC